jgi:hypothetical protein
MLGLTGFESEGEIKILSIEAKGGREDDDERQSSQNP